MKYTGLYEVLEWLESELKKSGAKVVTFGEATEYDLEKMTNTPGCHITPVSMGTEGMVQTYGLELFCYQLKEHFKFGSELAQENVIDALDETALILQRTSTRLAERRINIGDGAFATISSTGEFGAALMEGNSALMGWTGSVTIKVAGNVGRC